MTIAIDLRSLLSGKTSGVETYVIQTVQHLLSEQPENDYILWINASKNPKNLKRIQTIFEQFHVVRKNSSPMKHAERIFQSFPNSAVTTVVTGIPNRLLNASLTWLKLPAIDTLIEKACGKRPQVLWVPDLRPAATKKAKMALTVHDLAFLHYPQFFSYKTRLWYKAIQPKKLMSRFHKIICVSKATKKDLKEKYGITQNVTVIYPGVPENYRHTPLTPDIRKKYHLPKQYFLFLATLEPRKNLEKLVEGFHLFLKANPTENIQLVLAGQSNPSVFSKKESSLQKKLRELQKNIIFPGFIHEKDKAAVFSGATAFLYPSLLEGFGLPLLEAMKCETPIITSSQSSLPEVVQNAAILVDPKSPEQIAAAMKTVLKAPVQKTLKEKMRHRVALFSWKKTAQDLASSLKELV